MPKKGENIHKRKDGRWEGRYKKIIENNHKTSYGSVYGKTYKEVREKLFLKKMTVMEAKPNYPNKDMTIRDLLNKWETSNHVRLKGGSITKYSNMIHTHISPVIGEIRLSDISIHDINEFLTNKLKNGRLDGNGGLSSSYVRTMAHILSSALNLAVQEEWCKPFKSKISKPIISKVELPIMPIEDQRRLEIYALNDLSPINVGIMISLYTGLRIGEVCALTWNDIDLKAKIIKVNHTVSRVKSSSEMRKTELIIDRPKTASSVRKIPISSHLLKILQDFKEISPSLYVTSSKETFISPRTYTSQYYRVLESCSIKPINYHALRHTFATRCIEAGVDIKSLSEILGHSNVSITLNTYVHSSFEMKQKQIEKLVLKLDQ